MKKFIIGNDKNANPIVWEQEKNMNGHLLITGMTGSGKTYALRYLMKQLIQQKDADQIIVFDTCYSFEKEFCDELSAEGRVIHVRKDGFPDILTYFQKKSDEVFMSSYEVTDIIQRCFELGSRQKITFQKACEHMFAQKNNYERITLSEILDSVDEETKYGIDTKAKLQLLNAEFLNRDDVEFLDRLLSQKEQKYIVFNLSDIPLSLQTFCIEMILWFLTAFVWNEDKKDRTIVLDEFQNMKITKDSALRKLLVEGRKFGINLWMATQTLEIFPKEQVVVLSQAACKLYFRPSITEKRQILKVVRKEKQDIWMKLMENLRMGQCIVFFERERMQGPYLIQIPEQKRKWSDKKSLIRQNSGRVLVNNHDIKKRIRKVR